MSTQTLTPRQILDLPMTENDSGADTVRGYLITLLREVWRAQDDFSGKRPFGNSGWGHDLAIPLIQAGVIDGAVDENGYLDSVTDDDAYDRLINEAITALGDTS